MSGFVSAGGARLTARRLVIVLAACVAATLVIALLAPLVGFALTGSGPPHYELLSLRAYDPASPDHQILWLRIPRMLAGLLVGAALGGAGCALQALLRNPLADPFTLGISSGSSFVAVVAIRLGLDGALDGAGLGLAALLGAAATLVLVLRLAKIGRQLPPATLVLAGVTLSMFYSSATLLLQATGDFSDLEKMLTWMLGGFEAVRTGGLERAALPIFVGLAVLIAYGRELNALAAGSEVAASLGVAVGRTQIVIFATASLLVGATTSLVGPIGFVGLIVPHALRSVIGPDHRLLLPTSMFGGAILLTLCDTLARTIAGLHLPTGAVTAVLGGPFFIAILLGQKRRAALWGRG